MKSTIDLINNLNVILASKSPRRQQLLTDLGIEFTVNAQDVNETYPNNIHAEDIAEFLSNKKAKAFDLRKFPENTLVITADTTVVVDNYILEKPKDIPEAKNFLLQLSGREHTVISAVTIRTRKYRKSFSVSTNVCFSKLRDNDIDFYIDKYKPFDKAGAYGIQAYGAKFIKEVHGDYFTIVGMPIAKLYKKLKEL